MLRHTGLCPVLVYAALSGLVLFGYCLIDIRALRCANDDAFFRVRKNAIFFKTDVIEGFVG
jgi:hypothetical protein